MKYRVKRVPETTMVIGKSNAMENYKPGQRGHPHSTEMV